jgi:hypothetical protein
MPSMCFAFIACGAQNEDLKSVENNELGITHLRIDHRDEVDDRILEITGLDASGDELAMATLRTGMVFYGADMPEAWHPGTELTIMVDTYRKSYVSPDREAHTLPAPDDRSVDAFIRLAEVASAIEHEAGIRFRIPATDEVAFAAAACQGSNFPIDKGSPSQCCVDGANLYHKIASGTNVNKLAYRTTGQACRTSGGGTACTSDCYYGPCGAHVQGVADPNTTAAAVFTPTSAPTQCGRDSNGTAASGGVQAPEAYTGAQSLKAGVTASCPYDACQRSNGYADYTGPNGFWLTLQANCLDGGANGSLTWNGYTASCPSLRGSSITVWAPDAGTKWVTWSGGPIWHGFGGACSGQASCSGNWTTDVTVYGTFESCSPAC